MRRALLYPIALFLLLVLAGATLSAQTEPDPNPALERLLEQALSLASEGEWDQAMAVLDDAESIAPEDPRISSYRSSIEELSALDDAQKSWVRGDPATVKTDEGSDRTKIDDEPKFVIDRGDDGKRVDPGTFRDRFRGDFAIKFFALDPIINDPVSTWSSWDEFAYSSISVDIRYWLPFLGRSFGFNFGSGGYSWSPGNPSILFNTLDLGINLRGFLLEDETSRLEIGIDFGASLHSEKDVVAQSLANRGALYLGLWVSDPLFYHLFDADGLKNLLFSGGLRIYSSTGTELIETVRFHLDGAWLFTRFKAGIRLSWWDFSESSARRTILSFSLFGGIRY